MKIDILSTDGTATGRSIDLPDNIFGIEPNEHVLYLAVKQFNAAQRQGTHKAKERADIAGSTRKIKRQKGTGTARAGSIKSPIFRGGGRVFGPRPRTYSIALNKKLKRLARKSALSSKAKDGNILVVEDFTLESPKTSQFANIVGNVNPDGNKTLLVLGDYDKNLYLSSRNLQNSKVVNVNELNTYSIMHANKLVLSEGSIDRLKETFA